MYKCNDCGRKFEKPFTVHGACEVFKEKICPFSDCESSDIVKLTPEYLREQAILEKIDSDYEDKVDRREL